VLGGAPGKSGIVVDTHFAWLARRFGWTAHTDPDKIERDVAALLPQRAWTAASNRGDLARPSGLSRPQARLRRVRSGPVDARRSARPDRGGDRSQARQDRALFVTEPDVGKGTAWQPAGASGCGRRRSKSTMTAGALDRVEMLAA
jgi:hypothetical protein